MLAVVGLVIGGIWVAASAVQDELKISRFSQGILLSCTNMNNVFPRWTAPDGTGNLLITSAAYSAGVFPKDWVIRNSYISTHLETDGKYTPMEIYQWGKDFGGTEQLNGATSIDIDGVKKSDCLNLLADIGGRLSAMKGAGTSGSQNLPIRSIRNNPCNTYIFPVATDCYDNRHYLLTESTVDFNNLNCGPYNIMRFVCNNSMR